MKTYVLLKAGGLQAGIRPRTKLAEKDSSGQFWIIYPPPHRRAFERRYKSCTEVCAPDDIVAQWDRPPTNREIYSARMALSVER